MLIRRTKAKQIEINLFLNCFLAGTIVQGVMILGIAFAGCNSTLAIIFLIAATAANGAVSTGPIACVVDLSPNFAGKFITDI